MIVEYDCSSSRASRSGATEGRYATIDRYREMSGILINKILN